MRLFKNSSDFPVIIATCKESIMKKVKLQQLKNGLIYITVPRAVCQVKGWKKGDVMYWIEGKEGLILSKEEE